ncbi:hypothetical protein FBULB1_14299, partial [Fusarium bulbicola]
MDPKSYQNPELLFEDRPTDALGKGMPAFVSTGLSDIEESLLLENYQRNLACQSEIHERCVAILGALWGSSYNEKPTGSAVSGSSEAIFLGILAMKRKWQAENGDIVSPNGSALNIITGSHAHVAVTNAARANDIEIRTVSVGPENNYEQSYGRSIPIHVDAASGGFVAPFNGGKSSRWDFALPRVVSINVSGHKFGLTAAALGWIIWRDRKFLPADLLHKSSYLSGHHELPTLRYSQSSSNLLIQYYQLAHLGHQGLEIVIQDLLERSSALGKTLEETGMFTCISESHRTLANTLPVVVFRVNSAVQDQRPDFTEQWISDQLFNKGYSVPCSRPPVDGDDMKVLRVV